MISTRLADTGAIIPAAGQGKRMRGQGNKLFLELAGTPVLILTLKIFTQCDRIRKIVIPAAAQDITVIESLLDQYGTNKAIDVVEGGRERQDSVFQALKALGTDVERVVVHDGARPLLTLPELNRFLKEADPYESAVMAVPLKDTIKKVDPNGFVVETPPRDSYRAVQTPQVFNRDLLEKVHMSAAEQGFYTTDDASLLEAMQYNVKVISGSYENIKVTTPEDLLFAEAILRNRDKMEWNSQKC